MLSFAAILVLLAAVGVIGMLHRPPAPRGLPEDPGVEAARTALAGMPFDIGELRFPTSLAAGEPIPLVEGMRQDHQGGPAQRLEVAERRLREARERHPRDARLDALLGHVELAGLRLERAERRYRAAVARAPRYGEARLGLGVALARRAQTEGDARTARRLKLQGIAQLAAVEENDPFYLPALYDRILLLAEVGRLDEARRWTERYVALDPGSPWSAALMRRESLSRE